MTLCSKENETHRKRVPLDALMKRNKINFTPKKSRSVSIRKNKLDENTCFIVAFKDIPGISQEPWTMVRDEHKRLNYDLKIAPDGYELKNSQLFHTIEKFLSAFQNVATSSERKKGANGQGVVIFILCRSKIV
ncbi:reverse transcriptase [Plakobranchus ocellatus]|uniref:Reverse transcriptase n=1 Tax=Plakobranchus ocellatus TaxID=259542 RepID=A0AAV3Y6E7_9GAST|nr:reverse transcriptase [Plakobranchus ocellatus]